MACIKRKIKDYSFDELLFLMDGLIAKTHLNCGQTSDLELVDSTINELCISLQKSHGLLSFQEIEIAYANGWQKHYGDFFGLNNLTYFGWVNAFANEEKRLRIKRQLLEEKEKLTKKKTMNKLEIENFMRKAVLKCFAEFKNGVKIFDAGNAKYNFLTRRGLIQLTKERKIEIFNITKARVKAQALETKKSYEKIQDVLNKITDENIKSEARTEALRIYFSHLIEIGAELSDFWEQ